MTAITSAKLETVQFSCVVLPHSIRRHRVSEHWQSIALGYEIRSLGIFNYKSKCELKLSCKSNLVEDSTWLKMHSDVPEIRESSLTNTRYLPNKGGLPKADA